MTSTSSAVAWTVLCFGLLAGTAQAADTPAPASAAKPKAAASGAAPKTTAAPKDPGAATAGVKAPPKPKTPDGTASSPAK